MPSLTFDPQASLGAASQGLTNLPVIFGLPSRVNPFPSFVIGVTTTERARSRSMITGMQISDGDLFMKTARAAGSYTFSLILSSTPNVRNQQVLQMTKIVQQLSNVASSLYAGSISMPNLSGAVGNILTSQMRTLQGMKDGAQPIFALNLFMPLSSISINSSYLNSSWYIEDLYFNKSEAEQGVIAEITLKEVVQKTASGGPKTIIENLANQLLGPGVGSSVASAARAVAG